MGHSTAVEMVLAFIRAEVDAPRYRQCLTASGDVSQLVRLMCLTFGGPQVSGYASLRFVAEDATLNK